MSRKLYLAYLVLALVFAGVVWSWLDGGIVAVLLSTEIESADKLDYLRDLFDSTGPLAPLVYVAIVTVEVVVAPLPGAVLYLPGGVIFGGLLGGSLALAGNVLGAGIACWLMRTIGGRALTRGFFLRTHLERYEEPIKRHGTWIIALLRVNPLTSSDLVSYAAGVTGIRVRAVMLGTAIGMAPLCFAQAYLASTLFELAPWLVWPLVGAALLYFAAVVLVLRHLARRHAASAVDEPADVG